MQRHLLIRGPNGDLLGVSLCAGRAGFERSELGRLSLPTLGGSSVRRGGGEQLVVCLR